MPAAAIPNLPQDIRLDLPGDLRNPDRDEALQKPAAVIVSLTGDQRFYVGHDLTPKDQISYKVGELLKRHGELAKPVSQPDLDRVVYLASAAGIDYQVVIDVLDQIRRQEVTTGALIVGRKLNAEDPSPATEKWGRFLITIPAQPNPNEDLRRLLPNPLTLMVSLSKDLRFSLNNKQSPEQGEPCFGLTAGYGSVGDATGLSRCLAFIFQRRGELHAYRPGFETRNDVSEDQRIERTIFIKAPRSIKYGDVVRTIDAVKGAGANPIGLQIDDLPQ